MIISTNDINQLDIVMHVFASWAVGYEFLKVI